MKLTFISLLLLLSGLFAGLPAKADGPADATSFAQKGYASYYARYFHGRYTASGERFDMNKMTAAHKTLPFGAFLKVVNTRNGKSVIVKVNDRGPYWGGRVIDLSLAAAQSIDMIKAGTALVAIEGLHPDSVEPAEPFGWRLKSETAANAADAPASAVETPEDSETLQKGDKDAPEAPQPAPAAHIAEASLPGANARKARKLKYVKTKLRKHGYYDADGVRANPKDFGVQIGAFDNPENAVDLMEKAEKEADEVVYLFVSEDEHAPYRVVFGQFASEEEARGAAAQLESRDLPKGHLHPYGEAAAR